MRMNAEALIGTVLGTCTLQQLIGQGGMGAVYLAQQSRPRRQVAVKVLLPVTQPTSNQHAAFLERFRLETDAAASLVHPNIMPVHEYGEQDGLAYLVMPYVSGGTLRDELESELPLPLPRVVNYLDQMAAALDIAHERGVIHRDVKPANILKTPEGRLLLTDFGLVKIIAEGQSAHNRLTGVGVPMGTPDYMAPEQAMGGEIDARADLYSLGVILYQMVTGSVPFKGDMPMQVVLQHLHSSPPPPRDLRRDLPATSEHVILRALAKNPADRYMRAQDLASAFRLVLTASGVPLDDMQGGSFSAGQSARDRFFKPRGLFDPVWQGSPANNEQGTATFASLTNAGSLSPRANDLIAQNNMPMPSFSSFQHPAQSPDVPQAPFPGQGTQQLESQQWAQPSADGTQLPNSATTRHTPFPLSPIRLEAQAGLTNANPFSRPSDALTNASARRKSEALPPPDLWQASPTDEDRSSSGNLAHLNSTAAFPRFNTTRALGDYDLPSDATGPLLIPNGDDDSGMTGTMKLTQPVKVVKVAIAPGQYMTGLLPVLPPTPEPAAPPMEITQPKNSLRKNLKFVVLAAVALLVVVSSVSFFLLQSRANQAGNKAAPVVAPNMAATASQQATTIALQHATATAQANLILVDPLRENGHNWHIAAGFVFKDGAYHITGGDAPAVALLPYESFGNLAYTLTSQEVNGDDNSVNNWFGLILRYNEHQLNGHTVRTFYCFEVLNRPGGEYQFRKYDDSFGPNVDPWTRLWSQSFGGEYHQGHGPKSQNTFKVLASGSKFTFMVNGKQVGGAQDGAFANGQIGMLVNLKGTEVAFSDLVLTNN